ncbi:hypothetical protein V9K67_21675 [Paraflavisolibacter sp. H34]|uniref:hypothetical protein n=1 Tax=Huijunlia imazamoxiresistens TaxID=3127457 RepID=UPI0030186A90
MVPWHTLNIQELVRAGYFAANTQAIDAYSLEFAIETAHTIANPFLRDKIILRTSYTNFGRYFIHRKWAFSNPMLPQPVGPITYFCHRIVLDNPYRTELLYMWGDKSRNDLPPARVIAGFL